VYILLFVLFGVAMSDLNVVIFAGQQTGLMDRLGLPVMSGHENLDRLHLWSQLAIGFKLDTDCRFVDLPMWWGGGRLMTSHRVISWHHVAITVELSHSHISQEQLNHSTLNVTHRPSVGRPA